MQGYDTQNVEIYFLGSVTLKRTIRNNRYQWHGLKGQCPNGLSSPSNLQGWITSAAVWCNRNLKISLEYYAHHSDPAVKLAEAEGESDTQAKSFRPISPSSCVLKTFARLINKRIGDGALKVNSFYRNQFAYQRRKFCKLVGAFLDICRWRFWLQCKLFDKMRCRTALDRDTDSKVDRFSAAEYDNLHVHRYEDFNSWKIQESCD